MRVGYLFWCFRCILYMLILLALVANLIFNSGIFAGHKSVVVYNISYFDFQPSHGVFDACEIQTATRMSQFIKFWTENPDFKVIPAQHSSNYKTREQVIEKIGYDPKDDLKDYSYNVWEREHQTFILIGVVEYFRENYTKGGSSLRGVIFSGGILTSCSFEDYFNGTYLLTCPVMAKCVSLNVTGLHLTFLQHQSVTKRLDFAIVDEKKCVSFDVFHETPKAYWFLDKSNLWKWKDNGVIFPLDDDAQFCKLVDAMTRDRFYMIGSSHMRHQHNYLIVTCIRHISDLHKRLIFVYSRYSDGIVDKLDDFTTERSWKKCKFSKYTASENRTQSDLIQLDQIQQYLDHQAQFQNEEICYYDASMKTGLLIQTGSWDLVYNGLKSCIQDRMPKLDSAFNKLSHFRRTQAPSLKILVMGPPTFHPQEVYAENRNNDHIQIFSHALKSTSEKNGLGYVDVFNMMYPRFDRVTENNHYLSCDAEECHYEVGIVAIQLAVYALTEGAGGS